FCFGRPVAGAHQPTEALGGDDGMCEAAPSEPLVPAPTGDEVCITIEDDTQLDTETHWEDSQTPPEWHDNPFEGMNLDEMDLADSQAEVISLELDGDADTFVETLKGVLCPVPGSSDNPILNPMANPDLTEVEKYPCARPPQVGEIASAMSSAEPPRTSEEMAGMGGKEAKAKQNSKEECRDIGQTAAKLFRQKCDDYDYDDSSAYKIPRGLPEHHPGFIPLRLLKIMALLTSVFALKALPEKYSCVDMFAGQAAISRAFRARNLNVATLDIKIDRRDEELHEDQLNVHLDENRHVDGSLDPWDDANCWIERYAVILPPPRMVTPYRSQLSDGSVSLDVVMTPSPPPPPQRPSVKREILAAEETNKKARPVECPTACKTPSPAKAHSTGQPVARKLSFSSNNGQPGNPQTSSSKTPPRPSASPSLVTKQEPKPEEADPEVCITSIKHEGGFKSPAPAKSLAANSPPDAKAAPSLPAVPAKASPKEVPLQRPPPFPPTPKEGAVAKASPVDRSDVSGKGKGTATIATPQAATTSPVLKASPAAALPAPAANTAKASASPPPAKAHTAPTSSVAVASKGTAMAPPKATSIPSPPPPKTVAPPAKAHMAAATPEASKAAASTLALAHPTAPPTPTPAKAPAPATTPAPRPAPATAPAPPATAPATTPVPKPPAPKQSAVPQVQVANAIEPISYQDRQKHFATFKRQISGEAVSIAVPEEFLQAWQEAVSTNSKTAKGHLFQMWCHAGGDWGKNLGINASWRNRDQLLVMYNGNVKLVDDLLERKRSENMVKVLLDLSTTNKDISSEKVTMDLTADVDPGASEPTNPGDKEDKKKDDPAYDEVALSAALKLAVERSEYYNEDKKAADAVVRSLRPKGPRKGKKGQDEDEEPRHPSKRPRTGQPAANDKAVTSKILTFWLADLTRQQAEKSDATPLDGEVAVCVWGYARGLQVLDQSNLCMEDHQKREFFDCTLLHLQTYATGTMRLLRGVVTQLRSVFQEFAKGTGGNCYEEGNPESHCAQHDANCTTALR
ncbi:unnamed protein product, partial [Cladocopium goreaui]